MATTVYYEEYVSDYSKIRGDIIPVPIVATAHDTATAQEITLDTNAKFMRITTVAAAVSFDFTTAALMPASTKKRTVPANSSMLFEIPLNATKVALLTAA